MIKQYFEQLKQAIDGLDRQEINALINELYVLREKRGRLFVLGVGGSAANASHAVSDFRKLCEIEAYAPTDNVAELTARINDERFKYVFSEWLKISKFNEKDAILVLSVGGGDADRQISENLIYAILLARDVGAKIFGIVGRDGGYTKRVADVCVLIPTINPLLITPIVESLQAMILHTIAFHPTLQVNQSKWEQISLK